MRGPVIVKCPICQPGPYGYSGTIISKVCESCKRLLNKPHITELEDRDGLETR